MANRYERHLLDAIHSLVLANQAIESKVNRHDQILESQAREIAELQRQVMVYRNNAILSDLNAGLSGREVADKYNLSSRRISQIRNRQ